LPLELPYSAPMRRFGEVTGLDGSVSSSPAMSPPLLRSDRVCACAGLSRCAGNRLPGGGETPQPRRSDPHGAVCLGVRVRRPHQVCRAGSLQSEEHTSELQSRFDLVCRLLLEKKKQQSAQTTSTIHNT